MRLLLPLLFLLASCRADPPSKDDDTKITLIRIETKRPLMGTLFQIITYTAQPDQGYQDLEEAFDLASKFSDRATDYDPDSELNRLTKSPVGTPIKVSDDLFAVLLLGQKLAHETNRIFDPTYGPLTHLWRESNRTRRIPADEEIAAARLRCGIHLLTFDEKNKTITVARDDMQLDLGGIAKGFAADLIFDHLQKKGYSKTLVAAAGDLRIGDPPPDKDAWNVGLRTFRLTPTSSLPLKNCAVSTSGDLFQSFSDEGKTYSHLIDHRTGLGLTTRRAASVILPEAKLTDPFATAACLSDDPKSLFKNHPDASIRVIYEDNKLPPITTGVFAN